MATTLSPFDTAAWLPKELLRGKPNNSTCSSPIPSSEEVLAWCLAQHEKHHSNMPGPGGRNSWLAAFSMFCNEKGVPEADLLALAYQWQASDFPEAEIRRTIHGIYKRNAAQHGSKPFASQITCETLAGKSESLNKPSATLLPEPIPEQVYAALPIWLRKCCEQFSPGAERDVMLLGTLGVLSGCFPDVKGIYDGTPVWLNIFTFVLAPAASGKGALRWARKLAWPWHQQLTTASRLAADEYQLQLLAWKGRRKGKHTTVEAPPPPPPFKQLYLPANTSAAAIMRALADNDGRGIICETEADTLSGALGQDFGNFSDLLRKAFHHEPVSLMRKTDPEQIDIASTAIAIVLTGTVAQLRRLIPTAEDGLFSRFLFYTFEQEAKWRDVGPAGGRGNLGQFFDQQANVVSRMIQATAGQEITFELSLTDWATLNAACEDGLARAVVIAGADGASSAFRLGLTIFRLAGILSLLRCFENGIAPGTRIVAEEQDVQTAILIAETCRTHALYLLETLSAGRAANRPSSLAQRKAEMQAKAFALRQEGKSFRDIEAELNIPRSTIEGWLKNP